MSDEPKPTARVDDWVAHDNSQHWKFFAWLATTALQARYLTLAFAWTPAGALLFGASILIEWWVGDFIDSTVEDIAMKNADPAEKRVATGSPNVFVQDIPAVRGEKEDKTDTCHNAKVEQGSRWVSINKKAAARWFDRTSCSGGATIREGKGLPKAEVFMGGPPSHYSNTADYHEKAKLAWSLFQIWKGFSNGIGQGIKSINPRNTPFVPRAHPSSVTASRTSAAGPVRRASTGSPTRRTHPRTELENHEQPRDRNHCHRRHDRRSHLCDQAGDEPAVPGRAPRDLV
jgi:uncharacterized Zn-binding protein involved in type VI secretion